MGFASNSVKQEYLLAEISRGTTAVTCNTCKCFFISMTTGNDIFPLKTSSCGNLSIVARSNVANPDWKYISEGRYPFPSCAYVHRCFQNGDVQVVTVAEYIRKVCQGHNELIFKVICYATRGVTRSDGTRDKKQVWRPGVRNWGLSEANVLCWRRYLWRCWDFLVPPAAIRRSHSDSEPGEFRPLAPLVTPLYAIT